METMKEKIGTFPFVVEPFSEDFTGRLSWRFLGNHLLRCASLHAGSCGFGYKEMAELRHAWVLSRLVVEIEDMPRTGEKYTIETWVSKVYRQFTDRLFAITGEGGRVYGHAYSTWALIDMGSRLPMDLSQLPDEGFTAAIAGREIPIKGPGRIRVKSTVPARNIPTHYSDLDINGHVNSIRYMEMALDLFPHETFRSQAPRRVEMAYCAETRCGETLLLFQDSAAEGRHCVEIRKETGEAVAKAAIEFPEGAQQAPACQRPAPGR